jgi:hypothetical protein
MKISENKMKKILLLLLLTSCTTTGIEKVVNEDVNLENENKIVIVLRISTLGKMQPEEYAESIKIWFSGYQTEKEVIVIADSENLNYFSSSNSRFYQVSSNNNFLKFKSIGIIKTTISENRTEIQQIMNSNNANYLIFYEIGGTYSTSLKAMKYSTIVTVIDNDEKIVYLDNQEIYDGNSNFDRDSMKNEFVDAVTQRLYTTLIELKIISES